MFSPVDLALFYPNVKICQTYLLYQVSGHEVEPEKGRRYCRLPNIPTSAEFFILSQALSQSDVTLAGENGRVVPS